MGEATAAAATAGEATAGETAAAAITSSYRLACADRAEPRDGAAVAARRAVNPAWDATPPDARTQAPAESPPL